jgi:hypothetical protein
MSYIGQTLPADTFQGFVTDRFTGDGTANKTFTLSKTPFNESAILVTIDGVVQEATDDFTVSGTTLTLVGTAPNNSEVNAIHIGGALPIGQAASLDLNGASDQLILDADADTTISADTDDQIDFKLGGVDEMTMSSSGIVINEGSNDRDVRIEGNGDANAFFLDGEVDRVYLGNNTNTSVHNLDARLQIVGTDFDTSGMSMIRYSDSTPGPSLVFAKSRNATLGSNTIVQNGDELGKLRFTGADGVDFGNTAAQISAFCDGTPGENDMPGGFTFSTAADGATGVTEHMRLDSVGRLTLGGFTDDSGSAGRIRTQSDANDNYVFYFTNTGNSSPYGGQVQFSAASPDNNASTFLNFRDSTTVRCTIYSDGDIKNHDGTFTSISSDERLKSNIVDANSQWDDIKAIKFRNFKKKDDIEQYGADNAKILLGVVAQEAESVTPKLVQNRDPDVEEIKLNPAFGTLYEDGDTIPEGKKIGDIKEVKEQVKTFKDSILFWKCAKALQEAMAKIETLETKVKALEDA